MADIDAAARPATFRFNPETTAVIVVDMQNDFASKGGMFERAGIDVSSIQAIVPKVQEVLTAARSARMPVIYLKMAFRADLSDSGHPTSPIWLKHARFGAGNEVTGPHGEPSRILIRDTWNTEIIDRLAPAPGDAVVYKSRFSGFHGTELQNVLQSRGIERLIVVGATTSVCVDSTVRDAMFLDYHCLVISDAVAEPIALDAPRSNHEASLLTFELLFAHVATTADLVGALRSATQEGPGADSTSGRPAETTPQGIAMAGSPQ